MAAPRIVPAGAQFVEKLSGTAFVPRGFNLIRHRPDGIGTFSPRQAWHPPEFAGLYDEQEYRSILFNLAVHGFNTVRVFATGVDLLGPNGQLNPAYIDNVVSFLKWAQHYDVYVILVVGGGLPGGTYSAQADAGRKLGVGGEQALYLEDSFVVAKARLCTDWLAAIAVRDNSLLSSIFSIELVNELPVTSTDFPFSESAGAFTFRGKTYDLASADERRALIDAGTRFMCDTAVDAIRTVDADLMVSCSTLEPHAWTQRVDYLDNFNAGRVSGKAGLFAVSPRGLAESKLSYVDVHMPSDLLADPNAYFTKIEWPAFKLKKPLLCGEMQVGRTYPDAAVFWAALRLAQVPGALLWDYDLETNLRSGMDNAGEVFRSLVPTCKNQFVRGPVRYISGGSIAAGFLTPDHLRTYFALFGDAKDGAVVAADEGTVPPSKFYFVWNNTMYFSRGNGHFVGFTRPIAYDSHRAWNPNVPHLGIFGTSPNGFMTEDFPPLSDYPKPGEFYFRWGGPSGPYFLANGNGRYTRIGIKTEWLAHILARQSSQMPVPPLYAEVFLDPPTRFMIAT